MTTRKLVPAKLAVSFMLLICLSGATCLPGHPPFPKHPGIRLLTPDLGLHRDPSWSPDGTRLVFSSAPLPRGTPPEIYTMDIEGKNRVRLTNDSAYNIQPAWSPKGNRIAFVSLRDDTWVIYTMNPDGDDVVRLVEGGEPAWSPDGEKIAFQVGDEGEAEIFVWEQGQVTRLTSNIYYDAHPSWSPDGRRIVFSSKRKDTTGDGLIDHADRCQLYMMNADGSEQRPLTEGPDGYYEPVWSPNGQWIVFRREPYLGSDRGESVELLDINTRQMQILLKRSLCHDFAWSPDGRQLAFVVVGDAWDIYVMDVAVVLGKPFP